MNPHVELSEAQERLRKMQMVEEYLQTARRPDDQLRVNFTDYMQSLCDEKVRAKAMGSALSSLWSRPHDTEKS